MAKEYDVVVLGAGPGGYVAAIRAAQLGKKTAIIEKKYWGGVCTNVGCIPSKALLHNAEIAELLNHRAEEFGIKGSFEIDYSSAFKRSRKVVDTNIEGIKFLMKKNKIDVYEGWAEFDNASAMTVNLNDGKSEQLTFKNCIIGVGATTRLIPGTKLSERVVTYEEQILEEKLPKSIVIVGMGAIGTEFAYVLHNYGVEVTMVEFLDNILPLEDEEISKELAKVYKKRGIKLLTGTGVDSIEETKDGVKVHVTDRKSGNKSVLEADKVMQAIGFVPRVEGYGLEKTGVKLTERGAIEINDVMQTSVPHIYAIGDVTAKLMLAHTSEAMALIAAEHLAGHTNLNTLDYIMIPRATYCNPQVASFGFTEKQAREKGYDVNVVKFPFMANGKARGLAETGGFIKLISDKKYGELLGAHLIGANVTELLPELTLAQKWELTAAEIAQNVHAHPTLSEVIKDAAHGLEGHMINL